MICVHWLLLINFCEVKDGLSIIILYIKSLMALGSIPQVAGEEVDGEGLIYEVHTEEMEYEAS